MALMEAPGSALESRAPVPAKPVLKLRFEPHKTFFVLPVDVKLSRCTMVANPLGVKIVRTASASDEARRKEELYADRRPVHGRVPRCRLKLSLATIRPSPSVFRLDKDEQGMRWRNIQVCPLDVDGQDPVRVRSLREPAQNKSNAPRLSNGGAAA